MISQYTISTVFKFDPLILDTIMEGTVSQIRYLSILHMKCRKSSLKKCQKLKVMTQIKDLNIEYLPRNPCSIDKREKIVCL